MTTFDYRSLLNVPAFPPDGYALLADQIGRVMNTKNDILLFQGEAILSLEAVATSIARPNRRALNIATSPYGAWFGTWLRRGGAEVVDLVATAGKPIKTSDVENAIVTSETTFDLVALVHAESASGIVNPLEEIAKLAQAHNILTIVDAVASIGGHTLNVDENKLDVVVIGPQKSLGGPAGVSAISVSEGAWRHFTHDKAPRFSILSIMDQKEQWLDQGRGALPRTPAALEFHAFKAALDEIENNGLDQLIIRHETAMRAIRAAVIAGGMPLWVNEEESSNLVTAVQLPSEINHRQFIKFANEINGHTIAEAVGPGTDRLIRINHTGSNADITVVSRNIDALSHAMRKIGANLIL